MNKKILLATLSLVAALMLAACGGAPAQSDSSAASSAAADSSAAAATSATDAAAGTASGIVVDEAAKTVTLPAVANAEPAESSIHILVNEKGSNAEVAHFLSPVTSRELYDALESIGAKHGDNIALEDTSGTIEGSDLQVTFEFDGKSYSPSDLVEGDAGRAAQMRFGGNIGPNEEVGTGCLMCLESCSLGIVSNAAYQYIEPETFTRTVDFPAEGTAVTVTFALK